MAITRMFLDTEFNGFEGELISLALYVNERDYFYAELKPPKEIHPWVAEHVIPHLCRTPLSRAEFNLSLCDYLLAHPNCTIIADWPEDFEHLLASIRGPNGRALSCGLKMEYIQSGDVQPELPHNAYSDAKALAKWYYRTNELVGVR